MKTNLLDTTFIIPVSYDHPDRLENLNLVREYLNHHFDTNIIVGEIGTHVMKSNMQFYYGGIFHRTKALNYMTLMAKTPYVVNWDADVLVEPHQIDTMIYALRSGNDVAYPYDGRFLLVPRSYIRPIQDTMTLKALQYVKFQSMGATSATGPSYGGAVGYSKEAFIRAGGENENFVSMGAEDQERWRRFNLLLKVSRVPGPLYHINHHRGVNSTFKHEHGRANQIYWDKLCRMTDQQFIEHIKTFTWLK
jgi:hypothetical protein